MMFDHCETCGRLIPFSEIFCSARCEAQAPAYEPSPAEIKRKAAEIRARWTEDERIKRSTVQHA